jgi:hypothetical protein
MLKYLNNTNYKTFQTVNMNIIKDKLPLFEYNLMNFERAHPAIKQSFYRK